MKRRRFYEPPIVTAGDDLRDLARLLENGNPYYSPGNQ